MPNVYRRSARKARRAAPTPPRPSEDLVVIPGFAELHDLGRDGVAERDEAADGPGEVLELAADLVDLGEEERRMGSAHGLVDGVEAVVPDAEGARLDVVPAVMKEDGGHPLDVDGRGHGRSVRGRNPRGGGPGSRRSRCAAAARTAG